MRTATTQSFTIKNNIISKLNEKYPNVNKSLLINNLFDYILSQENDLILEFCKKPNN